MKNWLRSLSKQDRRSIGIDIATVQYGWPIGMPLVRSLGKGLWEIRSRLQNQVIARVLFYAKFNRIFLLHGFIKKSQKTPRLDIEIARNRMRACKLMLENA